MVRYTDIKADLEDELDGVRQEGAALENVSINLFFHYWEAKDENSPIFIRYPALGYYFYFGSKIS